MIDPVLWRIISYRMHLQNHVRCRWYNNLPLRASTVEAQGFCTLASSWSCNFFVLWSLRLRNFVPCWSYVNYLYRIGDQPLTWRLTNPFPERIISYLTSKLKPHHIHMGLFFFFFIGEYFQIIFISSNFYYDLLFIYFFNWNRKIIYNF